METIKVSVILPSLNVGKYIEECLMSVVQQTLKELEIICIDASSTDGTREIIEKYANLDSRIKVVDINVRSVGYSYNLGIRMARGEYIGFVETDDYIRLDMFQTLYEKAQEKGLDYVKGNHCRFVGDGTERFFSESKVFQNAPFSGLYNSVIKVADYPEVNWFDYCMWNGIYKKEFLTENHVVLNETEGAAYQDHGFQWQTMLNAKRAMYLDEAFYYYRIDNGNASMKNMKGFIKDYNEFLFVKKILQDSNVTREHWMVLYDKLFYTLRRWLELFEINEVEFDSEQTDVFTKWVVELQKGRERDLLSPKLIGISEYADMILLLSDKEVFRKYISSKARAKIEYLREFCRQLEGKDIVIFGAGKFGKHLYVKIARDQKINVRCFCDNGELLDKQFMNVRIMSPLEAIDNYPDAFYVVANHSGFLDCMRQLIANGVSKEHILYFEMTNLEI